MKKFDKDDLDKLSIKELKFEGIIGFFRLNQSVFYRLVKSRSGYYFSNNEELLHFSKSFKETVRYYLDANNDKLLQFKNLSDFCKFTQSNSKDRFKKYAKEIIVDDKFSDFVINEKDIICYKTPGEDICILHYINLSRYAFGSIFCSLQKSSFRFESNNAKDSLRNAVKAGKDVFILSKDEFKDFFNKS